MYTVTDAMTPDPVAVKPDDTVEHAEFLMRQGRMRHLPVVHHGKLVGLVTKSDILRHKAQWPAEALLVREVMVHDVLTATGALPLRRAARMLYDRKFGCLPVIDEHRAVVGILTETDFIRFAAEMATELDRVEATASRVA